MTGNFNNLHSLGLPKKAAEVLPTAGGPGKDSVVTSESRGHNVPLGLTARVSLPIMDHTKTTENEDKRVQSQ